MWRWSVLFLFSILFEIFLDLPVNAANISLEELIRFEKDHPEAEFETNLLSQLQRRHLVFVDGILSELAQIPNNYYTDSIEQADRLGIPSTHLSYPSSASIPDNAIRLCHDLKQIFLQKQTPLILIGHSMGGAEALYCVLHSPELLILNIVDKVVLIQPAIGGSILAEHMDKRFYSRWMKYFLGKGLNSLRSEVASANFERVYRHFQEKLRSLFSAFGPDRPGIEHQKISEKVFYVRSYLPESELVSWGVWIVQAFTEPEWFQETSNDGLLAVNDQILDVTPAFGTDLGLLEADHIELVVSGVVSRASREDRMAFMRALLKAIHP